MPGSDLVRAWKDPDERGDAAHPAGEITLDELSGGLTAEALRPIHTWPVLCDKSFAWPCISVVFCCTPW